MLTTDQSFVELLAAAAAKTAQVEYAPISKRLARLRAALDAYEEVGRQLAEKRVMQRVFGALDAEIPSNLSKVTDEQFDEVLSELLDAMEAVENLTVEEEDADPTPPPPPVVASVPQPLPKPVQLVKAAPPPVAAQDIEKAQQLLKEISDLRHAGAGSMSHLRLKPLLQAIAAEARALVDSLPEQHVLHRSLVSEFRNIVRLKEDAGIPDFINGLAHGARGDWKALARESRSSVARFDLALAQFKKDDDKKVEKSAAVSPPPPSTPKVEESADLARFPNILRLVQKHGKLPIVGGLEVKERVRALKDSYGIEAEWYEVEKKSPRQVDSIVARVSSGKMPALVLLDHFLSSNSAKMLMKACDQARVDYVTAGRGGSGAIVLSLMVLEGRLSGKK